MMPELNIVEIPYDTCQIHFRYSRYLSEDGSHWIRHGLFRAYHLNGSLATEGNYIDGYEQGVWCDYYENGILAAKGLYEKGVDVGKWEFWNEDGSSMTE